MAIHDLDIDGRFEEAHDFIITVLIAESGGAITAREASKIADPILGP